MPLRGKSRGKFQKNGGGGSDGDFAAGGEDAEEEVVEQAVFGLARADAFDVGVEAADGRNNFDDLVGIVVSQPDVDFSELT